MEPWRPSTPHTAPRLSEVQRWRQRTAHDALADERERTLVAHSGRLFFGRAPVHRAPESEWESGRHEALHALRQAALYGEPAGSELYWVGLAPRAVFPDAHTQLDLFAERALGTELPAHVPATMRVEVREYPEGMPWRHRTAWVVLRRLQ